MRNIWHHFAKAIAALKWIILMVGCCGALPATAQRPASTPVGTELFLKTHCADCHQADNAEGGFDLAEIAAGLDDRSNDRWVRVVDRVAAGEMPPDDAPAITKKEQTQFLQTTKGWLTDQQRNKHQEVGRVPSRRMTNLQLERTLQDLLAIDVPLSRELPEEPRTNGFTGIAATQSISHFQLQQHLGVVDKALAAAFERVLSAEDEVQHGWTKTFSAQQLARRQNVKRSRDPELIDGHAVSWHSNLPFYGRLPATTAPTDGWYRFKLKAKSLNPKFNNAVWCTIRSGRCVANAPQLDWIKAIELGTDHREIQFEAWLKAGDMLEIRPNDRGRKYGKFKGGQIDSGLGKPQNLAGVAIKSLEMARFYHHSYDDAKVAVFKKIQLKKPSVARIKRAKKARSKLKGQEFLEFEMPQQSVKTPEPRRDLFRLVSRFAQRSFRRRASKALLDSYAELALREYDRSKDFVDALRLGYRAVLCSPRFLYHQEKPGALDDFEIASRLSYMLWNRMPDTELFLLADKGELNHPETLEAQVERMLADPKGANFVKDFADQWLDLSQIDFTQPDRRRFWEFDPVVKHSMLAETTMFLDHLLRKDLNVKALIDSNYTFLNSRLARYYKVKGFEKIKNEQPAKTKLAKSDHRGGLITQGAIMKVTANGTSTSPVVRGVWISERILGVSIPPPPPNTPAIEPDVRGATTIREILAKHKSDVNCASCHDKVDPPGFALESFDPTGRFRKFYRKQGKGKPKFVPVDASGQTSDGVKFQDYDQFRSIMGKRSKQLAINVVEKLLVYGTGHRIEFVDREVVDSIVAQARPSRYGLKTLIKKVVISDVFLSK